MAQIIDLGRARRHAGTSSGTAKKSGRICSRGMPVSFSIWKTLTKGTPRSTQRVTVDLSTEHLRAKSAWRSPRSASSIVSDLTMPESCTTNNDSQGSGLRKPLTTEGAGIGILATMPKRPSKPPAKPLAAIYAKRQPKRPHYLAEIMDEQDVDRGKLIEDLGVDKGTLSRWLDEDNPTTPGTEWAAELGRYFAAGPDEDDFVDIFTHPAVARFQRLTRGRSREEIDRMLNTLEAAFSAKPAKRA